MQQLYTDVLKKAEREIDAIEFDQPERVKQVESISAYKNIGKISFDRKSISDFIEKLPGKNVLAKEYESDVPASVKLLNFYSQKSGYKSMGEVTDKVGNKYIGRVGEKTNDGKSYIREFPFIKGGAYDSPDLFENFTTYANEAIHKWNQFAEAEARLGTYIHSISDETERKKMIRKNIKLSSLGSRIWKVMSSLVTFYINERSIDGNFLEFPDNDTIVDFVTILRDQGDFTAISTEVLQFIFNYASLEKQKFIKNFIDERRNQLKTKLSPEEYAEIEADLLSMRVFIPSEVWTVPQKERPEWIKYLNESEREREDLIEITEWNINTNNIKFENFF